MIIVFFIISCSPDTPTVEVPSGAEKQLGNQLLLSPAIIHEQEKTALYFLIDNSTSVTPESAGCGDLGKENVSYVDFITANILKPLVPHEYSDNLSMGIGVFDNKFKSVQTISNIRDIANDWAAKVPNPETNTKYSLGIDGALREMQDLPDAEKKLLVLVTDGYFTDENYSEVKTLLEKIYSDSETPYPSVFVALLCDKYLSQWQTMETIQNVIVGRLEEITAELVNNYLNIFFFIRYPSHITC